MHAPTFTKGWGIPKAPLHTTFVLTYSVSSSYKSPLLSMRIDHTSTVTAVSYADLRAQGKGDFQAAASVWCSTVFFLYPVPRMLPFWGSQSCRAGNVIQWQIPCVRTCKKNNPEKLTESEILLLSPLSSPVYMLFPLGMTPESSLI